MDPEKPEKKRSPLERFAARGAEAAKDPRWQLPGWVAADARMRALFADLGSAPFGPDSVTGAATRAGVPFDFVLFYNPWRADPEGKGKKPFEELSKAELFDSVFEEHPPTPGPLWFLPDDCFWSRREPYLTAGETLREFVTGCRCDLAQDVLFTWTEMPRVSLIHHEGGYTHIFLPDAPLIRGTQP